MKNLWGLKISNSKLFMFLALLVVSMFNPSFATNYYFANAGADTNAGDLLHPFQTVAKFNSLQSSLNPGDNIFFKRGDVFTGSLVIGKSGTFGNPITIGTYGTGISPVITALASVTNWTNLGKNIWESTTPVSTLSTLNLVLINNVNTRMGSTPDAGYCTFQSATDNSITSTSLNADAINYTGAQVAVRKGYSTTNLCTIISETGNTIQYNDPNPTAQQSAGTGFWIQNSLSAVTSKNEWYYNPSTKKIDIYSKGMPSNVQIATVTNVITNKGFSYVVITGLTVQGGNNDNIYNRGTTNNCTVSNCTISFCGNNGWENYNGTSDSVYNCNITNSGKAGIFNVGASPYFVSDTTYNSGVVFGQSDWDIRNSGIYCTGNNAVVKYNLVRNSGSNGIVVNGANYVCQYNWVDSSCLINNDNGGIYCNGSKGVSRIINSNIITSTIGNPLGTKTPTYYRANGLYLDEGCKGVVATNNTIANCNSYGMQIHTSSGNRIDSNTFYNNLENQVLYQNNKSSAMTSDTFRYNICFSKKGNQVCLLLNDNSNSITSMGPFSHNYYIRPTDNNEIVETNTGTYTKRTLSSWQSYSGQDDAAGSVPLTITDASALKFVYNPTAVTTTISLAGNYIDAKKTSYNGTITLAPYSSAVLIKTTTAGR